MMEKIKRVGGQEGGVVRKDSKVKVNQCDLQHPVPPAARRGQGDEHGCELGGTCSASNSSHRIPTLSIYLPRYLRSNELKWVS